MPAIRIEDRMPPATQLTYFDWMATVIHINAHPEERALLWYLNDIPLVFQDLSNPELLEMDHNWFGWCDWLKDLYLRMGGHQNGFVSQTPQYSIFEWLVCIAIKVEDDIMHDPFAYPEDRSWCWFWAIISNLGLAHWTGSPIVVERTIEALMTRNFSPNGSGSICGLLPNVIIDMRTVPFWAQMNHWATQNYDWSMQ